jgi:hypothetical protein
MFCHVAPIRMPCSRSLAYCPVDLICRCEDVAHSDTYSATGILIRDAVDPDRALAYFGAE